ncbi:PX-associated-domain-containing protein [Pleurostoma richardsiae]|uniref:PX-associated-domain-containing protein n=1 Tax=Pleurostoma richardsiae TaxID=41990 RepID=A0AA38RA79_9PEZI|nr:PX-associated-domain-containing protein [Pleurostoma richardsiae]
MAASEPAQPASSQLTSPDLSPEQLRALFDILTHYETYTEAESFRDPSAIAKYGHPFAPKAGEPRGNTRSSSPLLHMLLTRIILPVPGVRDLPSHFWTVNFQGIMEKLGEANLSESYDKGAMGTRKTLTTAASVIHESVTRGMLGRVPREESRNLQKGPYDLGSTSSLTSAWDDCVHELIHGNLVDELFDHMMKSDSIEDHSPAIRAAADYVDIHLASFLHHVLVLTAEGQYLLKLLENVHKLVPYSAIRQTLRISNAATMLDAMIRLILAKLGVGAFSNWMGWTRNADEGMNLLQRIISLVLSWDSNDFKKVADKIEACKNGPTKEHLAAIRRHVQAPRTQHAEARSESIRQRKSIVVIIFDSANPRLSTSLTEGQHTQCLEYYSAQLSIRDREEITKVLCRQNPDIFTGAIRIAVDTFDVMIRALHNGLDLREHISAAQSFLDDLIQTSKPKNSSNDKNNSKSGSDGGVDGPIPPSVEDYVALLRRNRQSLFRYLHQFAKTCPSITEKFRIWAKQAVRNFSRDEPMGDRSKVAENGNAVDIKQAEDKAISTATAPQGGGAGAMSAILQRIFTDLPGDTKKSVRASLDMHTEYISSLERISGDRMQRILDSHLRDGNGVPQTGSGSSMSGPGVYLCRWQSLLDQTLITPDTPGGLVRRGRDVRGRRPTGKTGAVGAKESWDAEAISRKENAVVPEAPDVAAVVDALGKQFREMVAGLAAEVDHIDGV